MKKGYHRNEYYCVYDKKDNLVICGTVKEICARLDVTKSCISKAVKKKTIVRRKYMIFKENDTE